MNDCDKKLGLNKAITRRDILNGMGIIVAGAIVGGRSGAHAANGLAKLLSPILTQQHRLCLKMLYSKDIGLFLS